MSATDILSTLKRLEAQLASFSNAINDIPRTRAKFFQNQYVTGYPNGGVFSSGIGRSVFDFKSGAITLYDGTKDSFADTLKGQDLDYLTRLSVWVDSPINVVYGFKNKKSRVLTLDQYEYLDSIAFPFDKIEVTALLPANMVVYGSTSLEVSNAVLPTESQLRYSTGTSATSTAGFPTVTQVLLLPQWQSFAPNFQTGGKILSSSAIQFTSPYIYSPNVVRKTFLVFNTDTTNSLLVNIKGNGGDLSDTNWVDDASSGASTTITAGNNAVFDISTRYHYLLVRLKSNSATAGASFVMYYLGTSA